MFHPECALCRQNVTHSHIGIGDVFWANPEYARQGVVVGGAEIARVRTQLDSGWNENDGPDTPHPEGAVGVSAPPSQEGL